MKKIVIEIPHYHLTGLIAALLILYVVTFLAGYFWGKKSALEEFAEQIKNESFTDQVYASLCALYDQPGGFSNNAHTAHDTNGGEPEECVSNSLLTSLEESEDKDATSAAHFVAQLIGYGTQRQAQLYAQSLEKRGIAATVVARTSVSARGKKRVWYQVVTQPASYDDTQRLAERLAIEDRLAGVSIIESV